MAGRPRLFISHSSRNQALTEQIRDALQAPAGGHPGFEVLVDVDSLRAGEEWPIQLHAMMAHADAGLILLTPDAVARPHWILKEVFILTWRRSLDRSFKTFYVRGPEVADADLSASGFDPAHLQLIQRITETEPAAIAARIRADGPAAPAPATPFEELVSSFGDILAGVGDPLLKIVADKLGAARPPWRGPGQRDEYVACIAAQLLGGGLGQYERVTDLMNQLKGGSATTEPLRRVLRYVAPHWVPAEAIGQLSAVVASPAGGAAALNGAHVALYTAKMYVERVFPLRFDYQVEPLAGGSPGRFVEDYTDQICDVFRRLRNSRGSNDEIIARLRKVDPWLFIVVPPPADGDTMTRLRERFPRVVFLVWPGARLDELPGGLEVVRLVPAVDLDREDTEYEDWDAAMSVVRA